MLDLTEYGFECIARAPAIEKRSIEEIAMKRFNELFAGVDGVEVKHGHASFVMEARDKSLSIVVGVSGSLPSAFLYVDEENASNVPDAKYFHNRSSASFLKKSIAKGKTKSIDDCFEKAFLKALSLTVVPEFITVFRQVLENLKKPSIIEARAPHTEIIAKPCEDKKNIERFLKTLVPDVTGLKLESIEGDSSVRYIAEWHFKRSGRPFSACFEGDASDDVNELALFDLSNQDSLANATIEVDNHTGDISITHSEDKHDVLHCLRASS